jgi:hypothetical protein
MPPETHSDLPIVNLPRRSMSERYGGLFYLGIGGLVVLLALLTWFAYGLYRMRGPLERVYRLNDRTAPDDDRIAAAYDLSRDPRVSQRWRWDLALSRTPPPLARYLLAESLTAEAIAHDPKAYALAVARSEGWPDWLRLLLVRPLALGAIEGFALPRPPLAELSARPDPFLAAWADFTRAVAHPDDRAARSALERRSRTVGAGRDQARMLLAALEARPNDRAAILDRATRALRRQHPEAAQLWAGWNERGGRLVRESAPELHAEGAEAPRVEGARRSNPKQERHR